MQAVERQIVLFAKLTEPEVGCAVLHRFAISLAHMKQVADEIRKLRDMGKTVFIVTHDLELILSCCDHIVRLEKGQAVENYELNKDTDIRLRQFFTNES